MEWTAWNNGKHHASGAGYGFKVRQEDRDKSFNPAWQTVILTLPSLQGDIDVEVNVSKLSFWNEACRELINKKIGQWLRASKYAPWPKGMPPKFDVQYIGNRQFRVGQPTNR